MKVVRNILAVASKPKYALLTFLASSGLFSVFIFVNNISMFTSAFDATKDFWIMTSVFARAVEMISGVGGAIVIASSIAISILGGLSIAMLTYKMKNMNQSAGGGLLSFGGLFGGALSSTCSACSATLISILGIAGGLSIFPFKGLELSAVSIAVLLVSIYFMAKNLDVQTCGLKNKIKN
ncbi:MAG: hypothetical protein EPO62_06520 [Candidatus Nitrosotenuis sp.]|nr:MAG: hypothetical protein EPO62_06520 [Candidatus Nitrosotenuis sp.]